MESGTCTTGAEEWPVRAQTPPRSSSAAPLCSAIAEKEALVAFKALGPLIERIELPDGCQSQADEQSQLVMSVLPSGRLSRWGQDLMPNPT